jgi:hypothetical protein
MTKQVVKQILPNFFGEDFILSDIDLKIVLFYVKTIFQNNTETALYINENVITEKSEQPTNRVILMTLPPAS